MNNDDKAKRILDTFTGPWEKPLLIKMAKALPRWVSPDHLTVLGILAGFVIFAGFVLVRRSPWWIMLSNAGFVIHWWADSLDGTLARVRKHEREKYGYFVDHICDAFTTSLICVGLGLSPMMHPGFGLGIAIGYLMMNIYAHVLTYVEHVFKVSYGRFGPTEVRIIFMAGTTLVAFWNPAIFRLFRFRFMLGDVIGLAAASILMLVFIVSSIQKAFELDKVDKAKWNPPQP